MQSWLFVGPRLLAGIGQVTYKYLELVESLGHKADYVQFGDPVPLKNYDVGFAFVLPVTDVGHMLDRCRKKMYMTVCETLTVHESYGSLAQKYSPLYVPSTFCLEILRKQFPFGNWKLLPHWAPLPPYVFYTIGNVLDPRKNIKMLIEAFIRLQLPNAKLLLKATCKEPVNWKIPNITIINNLLSTQELDAQIHSQGHCYVNCSRSEGVGMGAVEAALRGKPVIITDFGGLKEYVPDTPFVVHCTEVPMERDDFLYQKGMIWGEPSLDDLMKHMKTCYDERITSWNHPGTLSLMNSVGHLLCDQ